MIAALRDMLVEFREQLVASGLMEKEDVNELETLNGLELKNKLVSTGILEETDVTALNGSGKKASSKKESGAKGSSAKGSSAKESGAEGSGAQASSTKGSGAEESSFAITLTKLKDILVEHDIIEKDDFAGLNDSELKKKLIEKEILEEADVITLRNEPISLDFLEELKKFVEKAFAYAISDDESRSIFADEDGNQVTDYVGKNNDVAAAILYDEHGRGDIHHGGRGTAEFEKYYSNSEAIGDSMKKSMKNLHAYLQKIGEKSDKSSKYRHLAENEDFIFLKDVIDKLYINILKYEPSTEEYRQEMKRDKYLKISYLYHEEYEKISYLYHEPKEYVYADPLVGHDLSNENNEDKAVEILLKAAAGAGFEILDGMLEFTENNKSLINDHLSYNLMTFKLKKFKRVSDPITIVCKKDEECKPAIIIEVGGEFKRKTYVEDEIDGEPEIKPYMTDVEIKKARELVRSNGEKVKGFAEDILNSLPEDWKNEFRDKYDVI